MGKNAIQCDVSSTKRPNVKCICFVIYKPKIVLPRYTRDKCVLWSALMFFLYMCHSTPAEKEKRIILFMVDILSVKWHKIKYQAPYRCRIDSNEISDAAEMVWQNDNNRQIDTA